jgi:pyrrolysyl-tRNA synthetase-like protein
MAREFKMKFSAYQLIRESGMYISRNKIMHKVNYVQKNNNTIIIITNCGRKIVIRDSKKGRIIRWLEKKHLKKYLQKCKKCKF